VTTLVQDQIDNSKPFLFYEAFKSSGRSAQATFYDNGTLNGPVDKRPVLKIWVGAP
jgi:hypothetical protein